MDAGVDDGSDDGPDELAGDAARAPDGERRCGEATDGRPYVMVLAVAPWARPRPEPVVATPVPTRH